MKKNFEISPRILSHLGEDLIKNESIALLELVKNAYDACATRCEVNFVFDNQDNLTKLIIDDDGSGMDRTIIEKIWLRVGTDHKLKNLKKNECDRIPLGEKGIGRFSVHKLGNEIVLISKKKQANEIKLKLDWNNLMKANTMQEFFAELDENKPPNCFKYKKTGTRIIVKDLKTNWDRRKLREIFRSLNSLNSPFEKTNTNFRVEVKSNNDVFKNLPTFNEIKDSALYYANCTMENKRITHFEYHFTPWETLTKLDSGRKVFLKDLKKQELNIVDESKETINLTYNKIGPVEFEVYIFEKDSQILSYANVEKKSIHEYLNQNGGVKVYRDGVRVYDYGERDNDWLGIDLKRVSRVGGRVSNNILIGAVRLNREFSFGLKEKTNREGFIENDSYHKLVSVINYVLSIIVRERNVDKQKLSTLYKKHKVIEPVLSDLDEVVKIIEEKVSPQETRDDLLKYLSRISDQYIEVKEILIKSANAGLNLVVVIHELEKIISELIGFVERKNFRKAFELSEMLEKIIRGYSVMIKKSEVTDYQLSEIVRIAVENYEFRFLDHNIEVISNYSNNNRTAYLSESESVSVLTNLLDNSIYWLSYSRRENRKISIQISEQINGYNSLVISDNGPGFNIPVDVAIEPFITGKPHNIGSGIGLHIVNEMMKAMKGKLLFFDSKDIQLPAKVRREKVTKSIIVLAFPIKK